MTSAGHGVQQTHLVCFFQMITLKLFTIALSVYFQVFLFIPFCILCIPLSLSWIVQWAGTVHFLAVHTGLLKITYFNEKHTCTYLIMYFNGIQLMFPCLIGRGIYHHLYQFLTLVHCLSSICISYSEVIIAFGPLYLVTICSVL